MFFHDYFCKTRVTFKISNFYEELGFLTLGIHLNRRRCFTKERIRYQPQRLDKVINKYLERSRSVAKIKDHYNELRYSERNKSD